MAAFMIRTCLKRSFFNTLLNDVATSNRSTKLLSMFDPECIYYRCYRTSPVMFKKKRIKKDDMMKTMNKLLLKIETKKNKPVIVIWKNMTVKELVESSQRSLEDILDAVEIVAGPNNYNEESIFEDPKILHDTVRRLGAKFQITQKQDSSEKTSNDVETDLDVTRRPLPDPSVLVKRHPVVTIMGHVDHGKTTLLDTLRNSSIVDSEFGGITQHIGAFNVTLSNGDRMTFLDTPGHAAFSAMRARGAHATDIVILVVAADDGVMEQTIQSIKMAKDANVPIIVAINKIDKPQANVKRTHQMLSQQGIHVEEVGGEIQSVNISALKGTNVELLMEAVSAQAEIMGLKGDPTGLVEGIVVESTNDQGRGKLATALIQRGTLRKGDVLVCGMAWAKVRSMFDHAGTPVSKAGLSEAVQIIGWRDGELPIAGEEILEVETEQKAHRVLRFRQSRQKETKSLEQQRVATEKLQEHLEDYKKALERKRALGRRKFIPDGLRTKINLPEDNFPKVNIIIKGDVVGSVEAIMDVVDTYGGEDKCRLSVVHYGIGQVTENDLDLAKTFKAIIYCFNTTAPRKLDQQARKEEIALRYHNVIYKLIDDLKEEINRVLPAETIEEVVGEADILQQFEINEGRKKVKVAGCRCVKGSLKKSALYKVKRNDEVIYSGKASSLRHLKDEVDFIKKDMECGVKLDNKDIDFVPGDTLICFKNVQKAQEVDWNPGF